ncbi:hypothetical protein MMC25_003959 [Agyrium rufum]|nr:hypothetical protein [Agyrium rufum]
MVLSEPAKQVPIGNKEHQIISRMPHAITMPNPGFQALILCGPGLSLNTFTSNPEEFPKALVPIANRPMVWYPLDWCYRMGITNIYLITPASSKTAIDAALSQNPHLTSLPSPRADILAPEGLTQTSGTAEILRLPEVQTIVTGDFIVLPCDLVCELPGESLLESWMVLQASLNGASAGNASYQGHGHGNSTEEGGRRGGLGVWYNAKTSDGVKNEEKDFIMTTPLEDPVVPPPAGSLRKQVTKLCYATSGDSLKDIVEEKEGFPLRHGLLRRYSRIRLLQSYRDAHIYLFPHWIMEMVKRNESFDTIGEDLIGWWAKATWQNGLGEKLGLRDILSPSRQKDSIDGEVEHLAESISIHNLSSTQTSSFSSRNLTPPKTPSPSSSVLQTKSSQPQPPKSANTTKNAKLSPKERPLSIPPILAYLHPTNTPLIRRVDTTPSLLQTSLYLAILSPPHPLSHPSPIPTSTCTIAPRTTIDQKTCLLDMNVSVAEKCVIKECIIGAGCTIATGARLTRCLLMDGVSIGEKVQLVNCTVGRRAVIRNGADLRDCEVEIGFVVGEGEEKKGEKLMVFEGLDEDMDDVDMGEDEMDGNGLEIGA